MKEHPESRFMMYGAIIGLGFLLTIPIFMSVQGEPLQPVSLQRTATIYSVTETAYFIAEQTRDLVSTSEIIVQPLPPDEYGEATAVPEVALQDEGLTGVSSDDLSIHRCPYLSLEYETGDNLPANTSFDVLGWNVDAEESMYYLISDDPTQSQEWVKASSQTTLSGDYLVSFPSATACREFVTISPTITDSAPTPTIVPPQISTATPQPPEPITLEITNEDAVESLIAEVPELEDPAVEFHPDELKITGVVKLDAPLGQTIDGDLEVLGVLEKVEADLLINVTYVGVRGRDITNDEEGQLVENLLNNWMRQLLIRRDVQDFELQEGVLIINALERQESVFPTLVSSVSPEVTPSLTATYPVATLTPTVALPQARPITATPGANNVITDSSASQDAEIDMVGDPDIRFFDDGIEIRGEMDEQRRFPSFMGLNELVASGNLVLNDEGYLEIVLDSVTIADQTITEPGILDPLTIAINQWLRTISPEPIESFNLTNGELNINPMD